MDELLNSNDVNIEDEESKENEIEIIHLINDSEHLFIKYAQQKLANNKSILDERSSNNLKNSNAEQRVLTDLFPRNYGAYDATAFTN